MRRNWRPTARRLRFAVFVQMQLKCSNDFADLQRRDLLRTCGEGAPDDRVVQHLPHKFTTLRSSNLLEYYKCTFLLLWLALCTLKRGENFAASGFAEAPVTTEACCNSWKNCAFCKANSM